MKKPPMMSLKKFDDDGNEVETSDAEKQAAAASVREALVSGKIEFAPGVLEDMKKRGLTREEIESWFAEAAGLKQ